VKLGVWHIWRSHQCGPTMCFISDGVLQIFQKWLEPIYMVHPIRVFVAALKYALACLVYSSISVYVNWLKLSPPPPPLTSIPVFRNLIFNTVCQIAEVSNLQHGASARVHGPTTHRRDAVVESCTSAVPPASVELTEYILCSHQMWMERDQSV
jgi:hypothetical protein